MSDAIGVGAVPDRELEMQFVDERRGRRLVVDRQGDDLDAELRKFGMCPGEPRELRVAVRAPRSTIDEDDAICASKVAGQ